MTDAAEIARLNDEINEACIAKDMRTAYTKLQQRREVENGRRSLTAALVAGVVLALAPGVAAAAQVGSPATLGAPVTHVAKPASKALIAKAEKFVLADVYRTAFKGARPNVTYTVACKGTMKLIACKTATIQGAGTAQEYTETLHVSHGEFVDHPGPIAGV
jgi:hypothetical protein